MTEINITGSQIHYFFICKRELWLFANGLNTEQESDQVQMGKFIHEFAYSRKRKEIQIGRIKIDFFEKGGEIHEVKKSKKAEKAHEFQLLYYLYYLKQLGLADLKGVIDYPLIRKRKTIVLTREKEQELLSILKEIDAILSKEKPPREKWTPFCRKCSYREFCWS